MMLALVIAGCAEAPDPLTSELPDMGSFQLMHNVVVTENAKQIPPSRSVDAAKWEEVLKAEIDRRFGGYAGGKDYHIGINIDGYALAPPGIPLVVSPKSILVVSANVWSNELGRKLHDKPKQITVFEGGAGAVVGSGLTRNAEEQMQALSRNAAFEIQKWMLENPQWFDLDG